MFKERIRDIVAALDAHDAGVYPDGTHLCRCGFSGTEGQWYVHAGEQLDARMAVS